MLQQTQAERVVDPYRRFLARFPTASACAGAGLGPVLEAWAGLGYNRRARHLHQAAVVMVERHGGEVPDDLAALLALPGVGPYTARAVLAFAFEEPVAVVDVNVHRVLARAVAGEPLSRRRPRAWPTPSSPRAGRGSGTRRSWRSGPRGARRGRRRAIVMSAGPCVCAWFLSPPVTPTRRRPRCAKPGSRARTARAGAGWSTPCARARCRPVGCGPCAGGPRTPNGPGVSPMPSSPRAWPAVGRATCLP